METYKNKMKGKTQETIDWEAEHTPAMCLADFEDVDWGDPGIGDWLHD